MRKLIAVFVIFLFLACQRGATQLNESKPLTEEQLNVSAVIQQLQQQYGETQSSRIEKGVRQGARFWRAEDGSPEDFADFCKKQFIADPKVVEEVFSRFEQNLEQIYGLNTIMQRELGRPIDVDQGEIRPSDLLFANLNPFVHLDEDFFKTKVAFVVLLNFPLTTLQERLDLGPNWTREQWAQTRLTQQFSSRVPAGVLQKLSQARVSADNYINNYNIFMNNLVTSAGERLFPEKLKLISHWGLRDEIKAQYTNPDGLKRQRLIQQVMERIIRQDIPAMVINDSKADWEPIKNEIKPNPANKSNQAEVNKPEANIRYQHLLEIFHGQQLVDPYYPDMPTLIDRRFQKNREIPEQEFEQLLVSVVSSPVAKQVAELIQKRLGRPLETFDIWYDGFKTRSTLDSKHLDDVVAKRYTTPASFQADIPRILTGLGFAPATADFLGAKIKVDPARGAGHASGAMLRSDHSSLRTRIPESGMNYKSFNIAMHELGHCVEQVFSLNRIDYYSLQGVPNTAFTEGFAFVFQARDLELLGIKLQDPKLDHLKALDKFWSTFEISGVSLVDMKVWHWMYDHPEATPAELNQAVQTISKEVWNTYFAPVLGVKDQILLGIYSHIIDAALYLPDYPLGFIIAFQVEHYFKDKNLGVEMERMCRLGSITPSAWMKAAIGVDISTEPLIKATEAAITVVK